MLKAVIFDMDGVLIDSIEVALRVRRKLLARYGVDLDAVPDPQGEGHRAASLKTLLTSVENHQGTHIDHDEFAKLSVEHMYEELQAHGAVADPALITLLKELKTHKIACAIATSSLRPAVMNKLRILGIASYFSVIVTGSDVEEHKPHPATYVFAMKKLGVTPKDCIIFEDSMTGVEAGHAAGCRVIGFTGYNSPEEPLSHVVMSIQGWNEISYDTLHELVGH